MKENTLLKIALVCSIAGIAILFFASSLAEPTESGNIQLLDEDTAATTVGKITNIRTTNTTTFLTIEETTKTDVVIFKTTNVPIREGDKIEIRGTTDRYKDKIQLIADEVRILN